MRLSLLRYLTDTPQFPRLQTAFPQNEIQEIEFALAIQPVVRIFFNKLQRHEPSKFSRYPVRSVGMNDKRKPQINLLAKRKYILLEIKKITKGSTTHVCTGCGSCCRNFAFIRLPQDDIKLLENFTGLTSEEFTNNIDKAAKKRFMKFQKNGDCIFLNIIDGSYSCSVYEARPGTCRNYPSTDIQRETCRVSSGRWRQPRSWANRDRTPHHWGALSHPHMAKFYTLFSLLTGKFRIGPNFNILIIFLIRTTGIVCNG